MLLAPVFARTLPTTEDRLLPTAFRFGASRGYFRERRAGFQGARLRLAILIGKYPSHGLRVAVFAVGRDRSFEEDRCFVRGNGHACRRACRDLDLCALDEEGAGVRNTKEYYRSFCRLREPEPSHRNGLGDAGVLQREHRILLKVLYTCISLNLEIQVPVLAI